MMCITVQITIYDGQAHHSANQSRPIKILQNMDVREPSAAQ